MVSKRQQVSPPEPDEGVEYIITVRKKPPKPVWLKPHQERFKAAMRQASAETAHLTGPERVKAMNERCRELMTQG